jgi:hypothetical protein
MMKAFGEAGNYSKHLLGRLAENDTRIIFLLVRAVEYSKAGSSL